MQKRIMFLVFAGALAQIPVTEPLGAAPASEDCVTAPNRQAPQGSHWYYRLDRTNHRKCWYLGDHGARARNAASTRAERSARSASPPAERPAADRQQPNEEVDAAQHAATMAVATQPAQKLADALIAAASENVGLSAAWPAAAASAGFGDAPALTSNQPIDEGRAVDQAGAAGDAPPVAAIPAAEAAPAAAAIDPKPALALLACALGLAAVLGRFTFKHVALRRPRRDHPGDRRDIAWIARERLQPTAPATDPDRTETPITPENVPFAPWRGAARRVPEDRLDTAEEIDQLLRLLEQDRERSAA
jgi:hypothetical protein